MYTGHKGGGTGDMVQLHDTGLERAMIGSDDFESTPHCAFTLPFPLFSILLPLGRWRGEVTQRLAWICRVPVDAGVCMCSGDGQPAGRVCSGSRWSGLQHQQQSTSGHRYTYGGACHYLASSSYLPYACHHSLCAIAALSSRVRGGIHDVCPEEHPTTLLMGP